MIGFILGVAVGVAATHFWPKIKAFIEAHVKLPF